ncbi:15783_t:CDS:1, partial [Funneliformis geosporum]
HGNKAGQCNLGEQYELGNGIEKDVSTAFYYYQKAANQEDLDAKFCLGYFYINGIGTEINKGKGFELYNETTGTKDFDVHKISYNKLTNDLDRVNYWYHKAAIDDNNKVALYNLGEIYETGKGGVHKNFIRAFEFFKNSANQGNLEAQYKVGYYYEHGIVVEDKKKAFDLYKTASEG